MGKFRTIDSFFKKIEGSNSENSTLLGSNVEASTSNERQLSMSVLPNLQELIPENILLDRQWWKWNYFTFYTHTKKKNLYMSPPNINS